VLTAAQQLIKIFAVISEANSQYFWLLNEQLDLKQAIEHNFFVGRHLSSPMSGYCAD
jgi:hypothetical protein